MKTRRFTRKFHALVITLAMVISQLVAVVPSMAADALLPIAQYVTKTGSVKCGADGNSAIYTGSVKMNVPMTEVMKSHEADMANAAANGWYPHGREGKNKIAYIEYNVTFPEAVNIGSIKVANTSSFINGNKILKTANGKTVNFKLYLNDVNWQGIYNAYNSDKANPDAHTVNIEIPYSFTASSKADAAKFEGENITGKGDFAFYPSGTAATFGFGLRTYNSDVAQLKFAENLQGCFSQDMTVIGDLEGDILIGNETEHDKVFESKKDAVHDFTGALKVKPIKEQMKKIEQMYNDPNGEKIKLSGMDTSFTASLELPDGMTFGTTAPKAKLEGANGKFEITETKLEGRKVTVTLKLKDAANFKTYKELADAINSVDDTLKVTVPGAKFTAAAMPDTNYTVNGTVGGSFKAKATQVDSGKEINFNFKWNGKQTADGSDAIAPNDLSKITFTLKYNKPNTPVNPTNPTNPTTPGKTTKVVKTVKTGDTTNLLFYLLMAGGSIAGIAGAASYRRRESR